MKLPLPPFKACKLTLSFLKEVEANGSRESGACFDTSGNFLVT
jgi:hypothetical protein